MNKKTAFFWLGYSAIFLLIVVWERVQASKTAYLIEKSQQEINLKTAKIQHLNFQLQKMKSPEQLELAAANRLNMSLPGPDRVIMLDENIKLPYRPAKNWLAKIFAGRG
ncbi:MAG: hypothetical protein NTW04_00750 [Elusimicrobia bacterium]|nr:hypothetical protein [Elusimicrobiota bacterium]